MSGQQPEPDSGYALDVSGDLWRRIEDGRWVLVGNRTGGRPSDPRAWAWVAKRFGLMTPLLPAERPDGVLEDAVPFVGWVEQTGSRYLLLLPNGSVLAVFDGKEVEDMGIPVPPDPEPSLAERLRERAELLRAADRDGWDREIALTDAAMLDEAADELENHP